MKRTVEKTGLVQPAFTVLSDPIATHVQCSIDSGQKTEPMYECPMVAAYLI